MMVFLALLAYEDIRTGKLNVIVIAACGASGLILRLLSGAAVPDIILGTASGILLLILAFASRQAVGYGDGLLFAASGIYLGLIRNIIFLLLTMLLGAVASIILLATGIKKKNESIPFAPFMLAGYVLMMGLY